MIKSIRVASFLSGLFTLMIATLTGCNSLQDSQVNSFSMTSNRLSRQAMQSRRFETSDMTLLLKAIIAVLQDQNYIIRESNSKLGVIFADKTTQEKRPTVLWGNPVDMFEAGIPAPGFGIGWGGFDGPSFGLGGFGDVPYITRRQTSISVVITPALQSKSFVVKFLIQNRNFLNTGALQSAWIVKEPEVYQQLFNALSHTVYLEAYPL